MHKLLRWIFGVEAPAISEDAVVYAKRLSEVLIEQRRLLEALRDDHEALKLKFTSFQGRVYAWRRGGAPGIPAEPPTEPQELPLSDPRVTKEELRARLLVPGKPFKHN